MDELSIIAERAGGWEALARALLAEIKTPARRIPKFQNSSSTKIRKRRTKVYDDQWMYQLLGRFARKTRRLGGRDTERYVIEQSIRALYLQKLRPGPVAKRAAVHVVQKRLSELRRKYHYLFKSPPSMPLNESALAGLNEDEVERWSNTGSQNSLSKTA